MNILKFPKLIIGLLLSVLAILLFFFSTIFKIAIMFVAIFVVYKHFPPNFKKLTHIEFGVLLSGIFITLIFLGKGFGFLSAGLPSAVQNTVQTASLTPLNIALIFIIAVLGIMYFNKRKRK